MNTIDHDRGRPATNETPSGLSTITDPLSVPTGTDDRPRCVACNHVVWTPASIRTGLGRECRRQLARTARGAAA